MNDINIAYEKSKVWMEEYPDNDTVGEQQILVRINNEVTNYCLYRVQLSESEYDEVYDALADYYTEMYY